MPNYDRFWDVHLTAENGWYDFGANIGVQGTYKVEKHEALGRNFVNLVKPPNPGGPGTIHSDLPGPQELPEKGFVCSAVSITAIRDSIKGKKSDPAVSPLIKWVSDPDHLGKMRVNAHGQQGGLLYMFKDRDHKADQYDGIPAWALAYWLGYNEMQGASRAWGPLGIFGSTGGLLTICIAACHSGVAGPNAQLSAVSDLAGKLKEVGFAGIEVTGSPDKVAVYPTEEWLKSQCTSEVNNNWPQTKTDEKLDTMKMSALRMYVKDQYDKLDALEEMNLSGAGKSLYKQIQNLRKEGLYRLYREILISTLYSALTDEYQGGKPGQWGYMMKLGNGKRKWVQLAKSKEKLRVLS